MVEVLDPATLRAHDSVRLPPAAVALLPIRPAALDLQPRYSPPSSWRVAPRSATPAMSPRMMTTQQTTTTP
jgi:hypothetical protein